MLQVITISTVFQVPNLKEWEEIQFGFNEKWNFPGCCGAIDGKHVVIKAPPSAGSEYYNYKGTNSIVLLGVVDHNYCFRYIDVGSYGRNADGGVFQYCDLYPLLENDSLLPKGGVLVGDDAFPLKTYLMKPYSKVNLTKEEKIYNYRTSRARRIVENGFGILASRFRIFQQNMAVKVPTTIKIVKAACAIHNWLRLTSPTTYTPPSCYDYEDIVNATIIQGEWSSELSQLPSMLRTRINNRPKKIAQQVRDRYKDYFNGEWSVEWQD